MTASYTGTTASPQPPDTAEELRAAYRSGRLVAQYPWVRRLLAELNGDQLGRLGQLLARLDPDEVLAAHPDTPSMTVAITGHGTLNELVAPLTAELARHGILLRPFVADFDGYVFELSDPDSALYAARPDIVLCVLDPAVVFDEVPTPWRYQDVEAVLTAKLRLLEQLAATFDAHGHGVLVFNTLPLLRKFTAQLVDLASRAHLGAAWREANARLLRLMDTTASLVVLDLEPVVAETPTTHDPRLSVYAKAHLSVDLLAGYAREVGHLARNLLGHTKKCLAVDLDEAVWGGVLGEDGPDGIEVSGSHRGEAFRAFQRVVKQLGSQGVLLAAVSKNDVEPVREVLREHAEMTLREHDFVRIAANWRPKHENLAELAADLNLGLDAFVFADDSPYERGLVRHAHAGIAVIALDDEPAYHTGHLLQDGWFDVRRLTAEDRQRPARYQDELERKDFMNSFDSLEDYLRQLDVGVDLRALVEQDVPRVAQLTLRTNQFNLTTRRMQPADVTRYAAEAGACVLTIRSHDRFGDNGLVGVVFTRRYGDAVHIDNFLLSCRVFSRGVEQTALAAVLRHARGAGTDAVFGTYRASAKNGKVAQFYPRHGFVKFTEDDGGTTFRHDLTEMLPVPDHVTVTETFAGFVAS